MLLKVTFSSSPDGEKKYAKPLVDFVVSTYYKGTGVEKVTAKLEEYLDNADKSEHNINFI